jgi:hypothetical protein
MNYTTAIAAADELRINTVPDEQKHRWIFELECRVAEMMGADEPRYEFPSDCDLLLPEQHQDVYVRYLVAMIDHYNGEDELYANDRVVFDDAFADARGWWIRHHRPKSAGNWRV